MDHKTFACQLPPKIMCIKIYTHQKITSIIIIKRVKEDNRMSTNRRERAFLAQNNKGGVKYRRKQLGTLDAYCAQQN